MSQPTQTTPSVDDDRPRQRPAPRGRADLNLTPMIDVVFNLLIFFIIGTEFRTIEGLLPTNLPQQEGVSAADVPQPLPPLRLILNNDPDTRLDPERHPFTAQITCPQLGNLTKPSDYVASGQPKAVLRPLEVLTDRLKQRIAEFGDKYRTDTPVIIQVESSVDYGNVMLVYDAVLGARMKQVSFAVQ